MGLFRYHPRHILLRMVSVAPTTSSFSRNFSMVLSAPPPGHDASNAFARASQPSRTAAAPPPRDTNQAVPLGTRRPGSPTTGRQSLGAASSLRQPAGEPHQQNAGAAAAAAPRRPTVPRVRVNARADTLYTQDVSSDPASASTALEALAKKIPCTLESVLPPVPTSFKCPITHEVMRDPVMTQDGNVYERDAIQEWFRRGHRTSPVTGAELTNLALLPEVPLRRAIEEYMALRPEIARRELSLRNDLVELRNTTAALEEELAAKQRLLHDLSSRTGHTEANSSSVQDSVSGPIGVAHSEGARCREPGEAVPSAHKECSSSHKPLPPVLANLPTPQRAGAGARAASKPSEPPPESETIQAGMGRTTKLQELINAMRWRGRSARRRPRSRSQGSTDAY